MPNQEIYFFGFYVDVYVLFSFIYLFIYSCISFHGILDNAGRSSALPYTLV